MYAENQATTAALGSAVKAGLIGLVTPFKRLKKSKIPHPLL